MQENKTPLVSVSMIAYQAQDYIARAIESVLAQQVDFPIELIIGDDCSRDRTRAICEEYARKHPGIIRLLPPEVNLGIGGNTARTMGQCLGKYIAICDGDDIWTDPHKLQKQVNFLENNPEYGVVYSDVETIDEAGKPVPDPEHDAIRLMYASGDVFFQLLQGNFINNSTALFRREHLRGHSISKKRNYLIPDYLRWLHIAARSRVHYQPEKTTAYRRMPQSLSKDSGMLASKGNWEALQRTLFRVIADFDRLNTRELTPAERRQLFRKILSLIFRKPGTARMKWQMARLLPHYFPGIRDFVQIAVRKSKALLPRAIQKTLATG